MRILSAAMQGLLNSDSITALPTFWLLTRKDGTILGFTDHDYPVVANGVTFEASSGFARSAMESHSDLSVSNMEATAILTSSLITEQDIRAGKYDFATIKIWMGIPDDTNFATYGIIALPGAFLGEITLQDGVWTAELLGLSFALSQTFIEVCLPSCSADLFDARCKLNASTYTDTSHITGVVIANLQFTVDTTGMRYCHGAFGYPDGTNPSTVPPYALGLLTWTRGKNAGVSCEVKEAFFDTSGNFNIQLFLPTAAAISPHDGFTITPGCDKTNVSCLYIYNNMLNMRGFPAIPGLNFLYDYGSAVT